LTTANDGKKYKTKFYNLDVIISVGYRVKSKQGTQFRIWATNVLRDYLLTAVFTIKYLRTFGFDVNNNLFENIHGISAMHL
jgi:hypothetical protein